jgi:hypothetical protein
MAPALGIGTSAEAEVTSRTISFLYPVHGDEVRPCKPSLISEQNICPIDGDVLKIA